MNSSTQARRFAQLAACCAVLSVIAACSSNEPQSKEASTTPASSVESSSPSAASTDQAPTETTEPGPAATTDVAEPPDLGDGLLSPQEMQLIFSAAGSIQDLPPDHMLHISACGSASTFTHVKPESSKIAVYQTAQGDAYWAYIGYYPGTADDAFAAATDTKGCNNYRVTNSGADLKAFPVSPAKAAGRVKGAPRHSLVRGFVDSQGNNYHVAYFQVGDIVLELFYFTSQGFSDLGMKSYEGYALAPFARLTKKA
jgi:hypothetical protein